ncbi:MAG: cell division protein FtsA [Deltaproteobacteria bacterium]|jgi:cell division protein FtsA|nr:cell division protein FtsA [Deltaproteobacteria bacterium]
MPDDDEILVGLDIGTTKICCIAAVPNRQGHLEIIGIGNAVSMGMSRGIVTNIDATTNSIDQAVKECQRMCGRRIDAVYVGIAGGHVHSFNSQGIVAVRDKDKKIITETDKKRAIDAALALNIPMDRDIIQNIPQEFKVDDIEGILDPLGMVGVRLEVKVHVITCAFNALQNLINCVGATGLDTRDVILESLASAEAVLTPQEMEVGSAILDIGGGTTDIAIFSGGTVKHSAVLALGGDSLTSDLAVGLKTTMDAAEGLKLTQGACLPKFMASLEPINVPSIGGMAPVQVDAEFFCTILEKRVEEIMDHVHREFIRCGYNEEAHQVVITGGSSLLAGMADLANQIFNRPVRIGIPRCEGGLSGLVNDPKFSTAVGLILYGLNHNEDALTVSKSEKPGPSLWTRLWQRLKSMIS